MKNKVKTGKTKKSNVIGGNISGNVTIGKDNSSGESNSRNSDFIDTIEKVSSKTGFVLITVFVLGLIVLFVVTR